MKNFILLFTITLIACGCVGRKEITKYSQIKEDKPDKLVIFCKDSSLITLDAFSLESDSVIKGMGTLEKNGRVNFSGTINLSEINYIAGQSNSFFRGLFTVALVGGVAAILLADKENTGVKYNLHFPASNLSSCPFLYSSEGKRYFLEGEAFGTGLGRGMETTTAIVLKNSDNNQAEMKIRFTNERPETHYFNYIEIDAIEHDKNSEIITDNNENYIPVFSKDNPVEASANGKDILSFINQNDKKLWDESITPANGSRDTIYLAFDNINRSKEGTLIVDAINTYFGTFTYYYLNDLLGDKYLEFMNCVETDAGVINDLRGYLKESSLNIEIFNGKEWVYSGAIKPEANFTSFTKGIRFNIPDGVGSVLKLRLTALKDVWRIDNMSCDFTKTKDPVVITREIISAVKNDGENILDKINSDDGNYCVLLPKDKIDINFIPQHTDAGKTITYGVKAKGYLQPWARESVSNGTSPIVKIDEGKKIDFVKNLLKNREFFLPVIYSEWGKEKHLFNN
jgi:hypothetical protein